MTEKGSQTDKGFDERVAQNTEKTKERIHRLKQEPNFLLVKGKDLEELESVVKIVEEKSRKLEIIEKQLKDTTILPQKRKELETERNKLIAEIVRLSVQIDSNLLKIENSFKAIGTHMQNAALENAMHNFYTWLRMMYAQMEKEYTKTSTEEETEKTPVEKKKEILEFISAVESVIATNHKNYSDAGENIVHLCATIKEDTISEDKVSAYGNLKVLFETDLAAKNILNDALKKTKF